MARSVRVRLSARSRSLYQREPLLTIIRTTIRDKGITGLYSGCSALVVGNAIKAGVRFVSYDHFKSLLADSEVSTFLSLFFFYFASSHPTGQSQCAEKSSRSVQFQRSSVHVTHCAISWLGCWHDGGHHRCHPFGNDQVRILRSFLLSRQPQPSRTKLIDDAKRPIPQYRGLVHGTMSIVRQEGIAGIYRGLFPVVRPLPLHVPYTVYISS